MCDVDNVKFLFINVLMNDGQIPKVFVSLADSSVSQAIVTDSFVVVEFVNEDITGAVVSFVFLKKS